MMTTKIKPAGAAPAAPYKAVSVSLPTEKSIPMTELQDFGLMVYGAPGIGKTTLCAQFPDALFFMFEPGADDKKVFKIDPTSWKEVLAYVDLLEKEQKAGTLRYKNFIFDTIDLAWDMVEDYICTEAGVDYLRDIGFGNGYKNAGKELREVLIRLKRLGGVVLLSHQKDQKVEKVVGGMNAYDYTHPSCSNTANDVVRKWVAVVGNYYIDEQGKRWMRIAPTKDVEAKCRLESNFRFSDGTPMVDVPMGDTPAEAFGNFEKAFKNVFQKTKVTLKK